MCLTEVFLLPHRALFVYLGPLSSFGGWALGRRGYYALLVSLSAGSRRQIHSDMRRLAREDAQSSVKDSELFKHCLSSDLSVEELQVFTPRDWSIPEAPIFSIPSLGRTAMWCCVKMLLSIGRKRNSSIFSSGRVRKFRHPARRRRQSGLERVCLDVLVPP